MQGITHAGWIRLVQWLVMVMMLCNYVLYGYWGFTSDSRSHSHSTGTSIGFKMLNSSQIMMVNWVQTKLCLISLDTKGRPPPTKASPPPTSRFRQFNRDPCHYQPPLHSS